MRWILLTLALAAAPALAQTSRPTDAPTTTPSADQVLNQMLKGPEAGKAAAIQPQSSAPLPDAASTAAGGGILREGTDVIDRVGRIQKTPDGQQTLFVFDSDGRAMSDAPLVILPNLKLMSMENAVSEASHDLRFRVTGTVTEYRGRNYILLQKVVVVQDRTQDF